MRKKLFPILTLAIMLAFGACSNEEILQDPNSGTNTGDGRTLTLTASMPDEPSTRVGLEQNADKSIDLTWEVGDKLQLAFVQGTTKVKQTITLTAENITNEGKKAIFGIELPAISTGFKDNVNFDLYGVCGGGTKKLGFDMGLPGGGGAGGEGTLTQYYDGDALVLGDADTNPYVQLPYNTGGAKSLETVHFRKDVMLTFTSKGVDATNPQISVVFNHLGSLFNITLKNTGTTSLENLEEAQLVGINNPENMNWAYNSGTGGKTYDLVTGEFLDTENGGNFISLKAAVSTLEAGATTTFWAWYPPLPDNDKVWPALQLQLKDGTTSEASTLAISVDSKPARTAATAAGKAYYFYAEVNGADITFTDESFGEYTVNVPTRGTLSTLLSATQKTNIKKLTITGEINKADYDVMKWDMPNLTYIDISQVTSYGEDGIENKIPAYAIGEYENPNTDIKTVVFPVNVTVIGKFAFYNCTGFTGSLTIPADVTSIGDYAFYNCRGFTGSLTIPANVTSIGNGAFQGCRGFTGSLTIPADVTSIGDYAFRDCSGFTGSLTIPADVTSIGSSAFRDCSGFTGSLTIPANVTSIGEQAFYSCHGFTGSLTIPAKVTSIGEQAFYSCIGFTGTLTIPDKVTSIGNHAFYNCHGFTGTLTIPNNVTSIGHGAFYNCNGFTGTLTIGNKVTSIGYDAFDWCTNVSAFKFLNATPITYSNLMLASGKPVIVPTEEAVTAYRDTWGSSIIPSRHTITAASDEQTSTFTDSRDSNIYKFVTIGNQVWMAENLKYLPEVVGAATGSKTAPNYYVYDYDGTDVTAAKGTDNYSTYGVLYNWPAANIACPTGWHLPSDGEWEQLIVYLGGDEAAGGKLKETGTVHWMSPNTGATNETGFTALPGGYRFQNNYTREFKFIGTDGFLWSASQSSNTNISSAWVMFASRSTANEVSPRPTTSCTLHFIS